MSAIWRRAAQLQVQGVPFAAAMRQARAELDPHYWSSRHVHEWFDVTQVGDRWRHEMCTGCDATRQTTMV